MYSAPVEVNESKFTTASLVYNTTYYWQVVAEDNLLARTTSTIWSFVTKSPAGVVNGKTYRRDGLSGLDNVNITSVR